VADRAGGEEGTPGPAPGNPSEADFDALYKTATPPWEIGRPQPPFVAIADAGLFRGRVLDLGCGTGEHALLAAASGHEAVGIDAAPTAIAMARAKAERLGSAARFEVADALALGQWGETFDTVLDSGLFHVFDDGDRVRLVDGLRVAVRPGGTYRLLCFSEHQPGDWGPRRVSQAEIRAAFAEGWRVDSIDAAEFVITISPGRAQAWLAAITRT
jgi:SAM-dependent methyltransferase